METNFLDHENRTDYGIPDASSGFRIISADDRQKRANLLPPAVKLFGNLFIEGELCILAGDNGAGKSILAMLIAEAISSGKKDLLGLIIESGFTKVLFYDLELSDRQFQSRVNGHIFHPNFLFAQYAGETLSFTEINQTVEATGAKVLIIDNLTALSEKNTIDPDAALKVIRGLNSIKRELSVSILVIAHTPKIPPGTDLTTNQISGSKKLTDLCDSAFFLGKSNQGQHIRYIKQVKTRQPYLVDPFSVEFDNSDNTKMVSLRFIGSCDELDHIGYQPFTQVDPRHAMALDLLSQGKSPEEIGKQFGVSRQTIYNWKKIYGL